MLNFSFVKHVYGVEVYQSLSKLRAICRRRQKDRLLHPLLDEREIVQVMEAKLLREGPQEFLQFCPSALALIHDLQMRGHFGPAAMFEAQCGENNKLRQKRLNEFDKKDTHSFYRQNQ
jgi:hypothetical protein